MFMNRRLLLKKALLLLPVTLSGPVFAGVKSRRYRLNRFMVAGFQYYDGPQLINRLQPGVLLDLVAESDNQHDYYAVRIEWQGRKLGYVPRSDNRHLSRLLRQDAKLRGEVLESAPQAVVWGMLKVGVGLEVG